MQTVELDKTGKIYVPKEIQQKMSGKEYYILVMPDGNVILHKVTKVKNPLKTFSGILKTKKSISQLRAEARQTAEQEVLEDVRRH